VDGKSKGLCGWGMEILREVFGGLELKKCLKKRGELDGDGR
jgi:hypothetical protein